MNIRMMWLLVAGCLLVFSEACRKDGTSDANLRVAMTDAPVDDPDVKSVFITVTEVRVDGQPVDGFQPVTFDILAYQEGALKILAEERIESGNYQSLTLVLDYSQGADGQTPGCWVEENDGTKHPLQSTSATLQVMGNYSVSADEKTTLVVDMDLRKAIRRESSGMYNYQFVTHGSLQSSLKMTVQGQTGIIKGQCQNDVTTSDRILVFVYQKGTFNLLLEKIALQGIAFPNAVASTAVQSSGQFEIHHLPPGDYEMVFIGCKDLNADGETDYQGVLLTEVLTGQNIQQVSVDAQSSTTVNVRITGLVPF